LLFGQRVPKTDSRCETYGTLDEVISLLGVARNLVKKTESPEIILKVQKELFEVNCELATGPEDYEKLVTRFRPITEEMAAGIESIIDRIEAQIELPKAFVIPGANLSSATLDVARATLRRAERRAVSLREQGEIKNEAILQYLNRLADLLFILARYEEA